MSTAQDVRRVLHGGDGRAALTVARSLGLDGPLQQVGDLVLLTLDGNPEDAAEFAAQCSDALRQRGGDGDRELADQIDQARGRAVPGLASLVELAVDREQLADLIDGGADSDGGRLDLRTGDVWPELTFADSYDDQQDEDADDPDRWLHIAPTGSRRAYHDMVAFAETRADRTLRALLDVALNGRGAFRRFKDVLFDRPDDREDWFLFSEDRRGGRTREWLADAGYRPTVRRQDGPN